MNRTLTKTNECLNIQYICFSSYIQLCQTFGFQTSHKQGDFR